MEGDVLAWLATKTTATTVLLLTVAVLFVVQVAKVVARRVPALADFTDWWIPGGVLGIALGLGAIELSVSGAVAGLVVGVLATGGHQYFTKACRLIARATPAGGPGIGTAKVLWALLGLAVAGAALSGCALPQAVLQTTQFEQAQIAADKLLLGQLFDGRREANERLMAAVDQAIAAAIERREREAALWMASHADGKPKSDAEKPVLFSSAWVIETIHGGDLAKQVLRDRIDADEVARAVALANLDDRARVLGQAGKLVVRSQQWSSETRGLVEDLLGKALKGAPAPPVLPPLAESLAAPAR